MPSLRERQRQFVQAVLHDAASPHGGEQPGQWDERIGVYRRNVFSNFRRALAATYPVVLRLTGAPFFHAAVDHYVLAIPSTCGDLNVYGDRFADFLGGYAPAKALSYLPCVARLEWAIDEANRARQSSLPPEVILAQLSTVPADRLPLLRLRLAPSCRLISSPYPVLRIWRTNQPDFDGDRRVDLGEGGDHMLVRRDLHGVALEKMNAGDHAWLCALAANATLGVAIEAAQRVDLTFDLASALGTHLGLGSLMDVADA